MTGDDQTDEQLFDEFREAFAPVRFNVSVDALRRLEQSGRPRPDTRASAAQEPVRLPRRGFVTVAAAAIASLAVAGGIMWSLRGSHPEPAGLTGGRKTGTIPLDTSSGYPSSLALSPDGRLLAVWNTRQSRLWNVADPAHPVKIATLPPTAAGSAGFSPDGRTLIVTTSTPDLNHGALQLWNITDPTRPGKTGEVPLTGPANFVALSPDGHTLIVSTMGTGATAIQFWNVSNPARPAIIGTLPSQPTQLPPELTISQDGKALAVTQSQQTGDAQITIWDITNPAHPVQQRTLASPANVNGAVLFDLDHVLGIVSSNGTELWNLSVPAHPTKITTLPAEPGTAEFLVPVLAADGTTLAVVRGNSPPGGGKVTYDQAVIWNIADPSRPVRTDVITVAPPGDAGFTISDDGHTFAIATGGHIALWNY